MATFPTARTALVLLLTTPFAGACLSPFDTMGNETSVTETESRIEEAKFEDDRIEDKHPVFDPSLTVTETFGDCEFTLNKSGSVARLDIVSMGAGETQLTDRLFPTRATAIAAAAAAGQADLVPSMEVVNGYMKPFNDGLYAATELAMQQGQQGNRAMLEELARVLETEAGRASVAARQPLEDAAVFVGAALELSGPGSGLSGSLRSRAAAMAAEFLSDPLRSRPIGFYTWSAELEQLFVQDRWLQNLDKKLSFGAAVALAAAIESTPALAESYQRAISLYAGLTNHYASFPLTVLFPYVDGFGSLEDVVGVRTRFKTDHPEEPYVCSGVELAFLPASRSRDTDFFMANYCDSAPANFMDALIGAIRTGALDLDPDPDTSGWYDYQLHALETLLVPEKGAESDHLLLTAAYKKKLVETFKSLVTQARETHVKQLAIGAETSMPAVTVDLHPRFPVEPFPTFYLRTARGYRFLSGFLGALFAPDPALFADNHRLNEDGTSSPLPLREELASETELLYGLFALTADSVGLNPNAQLLPDELAGIDLDECRARAKRWLAGWKSDADLLKDPRVIVPVGSSISGTTYWATIGVKVYKSTAKYVDGFEPKVVGAGFCRLGAWVERDYYLLAEEMVEVRLSPATPPPTRAELRAICDRHQTREKIVAALEAL